MFDRIDLVTSDVIFKLILDYYSDEEIENAKEVLHANFKSKSGRKIIRKGNDKSAKIVEDILKILHEMSAEMEKEAVPILVTDSSRFPPLDITHLDAATLYTDMITLKKEFSLMKEEKERDSKIINDINDKVSCLLSEKGIAMQNSNKLVSEPEVSHRTTPTCNSNYNFNRRSYSSVVKNNSTKKRPPPNPFTQKSKEWITVKPKIKSTPIGKIKNTNFKALFKPFHVFATRFLPNTSPNVVKDFVTIQFEAEVTCIKLATKFNSYSSFKITVTNVSQEDVFNDWMMDKMMDKWPEGILVKNFYSKTLSKERNTTSDPKANG